MNTIAFNILLALYSLLLMLCIVLWIRARKTKAYIKANNSVQRKYVITIVVVEEGTIVGATEVLKYTGTATTNMNTYERAIPYFAD